MLVAKIMRGYKSYRYESFQSFFLVIAIPMQKIELVLDASAQNLTSQNAGHANVDSI